MSRLRAGAPRRRTPTPARRTIARATAAIAVLVATLGVATIVPALVSPAPALAETAPAKPPATPASRAVRAELADGDYQTELPGGEDKADADATPAPSPGRALPPRMGALSSIATGLLWVLLVVVVLVVAVWLLREVLGFAPAPPAAAAIAVSPAAVHAVVVRPLRDAEALAAEGRFGEAIHILLLRTLDALVERGGLTLPPSLTSREVIAEVKLPAEADAALRGLVTAVEVSHFGGQQPGDADWQQCLASFHRFARAFGASARAPEEAA